MDDETIDRDETLQPEPVSKSAGSEVDRYIRELRSEAKTHRVRRQEAEARVTSLEAEWQAKLETQVAAAKKSADERLARAELKAEAVKAGIVDLDGLRLVDMKGVTLDEHGSVLGADALIAKLAEEKPYLFAKPASSTSSMSPAPKPEQAKTKRARDMSPAEYAAALAKLG